MKKAQISCPEVVLLKKHILVMSFIGKDHVPAPKLKDALLSCEDMKNAFYQVLHVGAAARTTSEGHGEHEYSCIWTSPFSSRWCRLYIRSVTSFMLTWVNTTCCGLKERYKTHLLIFTINNDLINVIIFVSDVILTEGTLVDVIFPWTLLACVFRMS